MKKQQRNSFVVAILMLVIGLSRLVTSGALSSMRAVDALLLFGVGMCAGVALVTGLQTLKSSAD